MFAQAVSGQVGPFRKSGITTIQINLGNACNLSCTHCHIGASPRGDKNMDSPTAERILLKLLKMDAGDVEFTGGTPELNPNLRMLISGLTGSAKRAAVRTNLTVLDTPEHASLIDFFSQHKVKLIGSLPSALAAQTDSQRGQGVFSTSIKVLRRLNNMGYGTDGRHLDLVHNPVGYHLPPGQAELERDYKQVLEHNHGIRFNNLITITNSPINRFKAQLAKKGMLDAYMALLKDSFNPDTLKNVMCRTLVSVDYMGRIYDCDFNLALGLGITGYEDKRFWDVDFNGFGPEITVSEHCYACTALKGSSCHGALIEDNCAEEASCVEEPCGIDVKQAVKLYYGTELKSTEGLKTTACCPATAPPGHISAVLPLIAEEIKTKYYGCGSPIPFVLEGLSVLDLGCGTGLDTYVISKLIGESGFVTGIDMTEAQIVIAKKYVQEQTRRFGFKTPNVQFIYDYIENAGQHFPPPGSLDLVVSNCVLNLIEDKAGVLGQVYRMLKPGGEFYFSDMYASRRVPDALRDDPVMYGECLGGCFYLRDFQRAAKAAGFKEPRVVTRKTVDITDEKIKKLASNIDFCSITYRLWKLDSLEDACEDYGHTALYKGGVKGSPQSFALDSSHVFELNRPTRVCGNTALMLTQTRLRDYFEVIGNFDEHFGDFRECETPGPKEENGGTGGDSGCAC